MGNEWVLPELKEVTEGKNPWLAQTSGESSRMHLVSHRE